MNDARWPVVLFASLGLLFFAALELYGADPEAKEVMLFARISSAKGKPIKNLPYDVRSMIDKIPPIIEDGFTDGQGILKVGVFPGAKYRINFSPTLHTPYYGENIITIPQIPTWSEAEPMDLVAQKCLTLRGKVMKPDGRPLPDMKVACTTENREGTVNTWATHTRASGSFAVPLVMRMDDVKYFLYGKHEEYEVKKHEISLQDTTEDLTLVAARKKPTITQQCALVDEEKNVIDFDGGCAIRGPVSYMRDIKDGRFVLLNLIPGEYELSLNGLAADGRYMLDSKFTVPTGVDELKFVIAESPETRILVLDEADNPIPDVEVIVQSDGIPFKSLTNDKGTATFKHPGELWVEVLHDAYLQQKRTRTKPGRDVTIRLEKGMVIQGTVLNEDGASVAGARVAFYCPESGEKWADTDTEGRFQIASLPEGRVKVLADHPEYAPSSQTFETGSVPRLDIVLKPGLEIPFKVEVKTEEIEGEPVADGGVAIISVHTNTILAGLSCKKVDIQTVRLNPGLYNVIWIGDELGVFLKDLTIRQADPVTITIDVPARGDIMSLKELNRKLLTVK